ncbi:11400_t:CDS:2 [Ambispora leptoticha]|uniref:11400_t:CDS:1 n=1 Tax=Ambispora leptoticha TaxID=144679 RepID=A0A9N9FQD7_9GLOM|nr:11400_t:CDS:2 [Ambispora leptoticha]
MDIGDGDDDEVVCCNCCNKGDLGVPIVDVDESDLIDSSRLKLTMRDLKKRPI